MRVHAIKVNNCVFYIYHVGILYTVKCEFSTEIGSNAMWQYFVECGDNIMNFIAISCT